MKLEMNWISVWTLAMTALASLSLSYFYLSNAFMPHAETIFTYYILTITLPYIVWKYNQVKFVEKRSIVIQFLND